MTTEKWPGHPFTYPPPAPAPPVASPCLDNPCWCGKHRPHSFDPWTQEGHDRFMARREAIS